MSAAARARTRPLAVLLVVAVAAVVLVVPTPAAALHQHCGDDLEGTYSLTNGHPDAAAVNPGWNGQEILQDYAIALQAIGFARSILGDVVAGFDASSDLLESTKDAGVPAALAAGTPASQIYNAAVYLPLSLSETALRIVLLTVQISDLVLIVSETVLGAINLNTELAVEDEGACGGTLGGDTLTMLWVATVQRHLASEGPPLALLMAPHDPELVSAQPVWPVLPRTEAGDFTWCPPLDDVLGRLPVASSGPLPDTGGDCSSTVPLGLLDAPDLGVQAVVTQTIGHLIAHGLPVYNAEALLAQADTALAERRYSDSFHLYRDAYQDAMTVVTR